jgi:hypothetical protein
MQINGAQLATVFSPKLLALQNDARKPVTIDVKANVEFDAASTGSSPATFAPSISQSSILLNEQQQARFVRFFSASDLPSPLDNKDMTSQASVAKLPNGVQQYLQVAATSNEFQQGLLDETV